MESQVQHESLADRAIEIFLEEIAVDSDLLEILTEYIKLTAEGIGPWKSILYFTYGQQKVESVMESLMAIIEETGIDYQTLRQVISEKILH